MPREPTSPTGRAAMASVFSAMSAVLIVFPVSGSASDCSECDPPWGTFLGFELAGNPGSDWMVAQADTPAGRERLARGPAVEADRAEDADEVDAPPPGDARPRERWRLAPMRWWGSAAYDVRSEKSQDTGRAMRHLVTARINLATYLWQPWFATVTGSLAVTAGRLNSPGNDTYAGESSRDRFITGNAELRLFPRSRFPLDATVSVGDSRTETNLTSFDYRNTRFLLGQRYASESNDWSASARFEHSVQTGGTIGRDTQDVIAFGYEMRRKLQNLEVNANLSRNRRDLTNEETLFETVAARHNATPTPSLSIDSTASLTRNSLQLTDAKTDASFAQASTAAFYRPENAPYTISGAARFSHANAGGGNSTSGAVSLGGTWEWSRNLRFSGNTSAQVANSGDASTRILAESASITYQADAVRFGESSYNYFGAVSESAASGGETRNYAAGVVVGHTLMRAWSLGSTASVSASLGQSGGYSRNQESTVRQLSHNAGIGFNWSSGTSFAYARLSGSDSRTFEGETTSTSLVNFQFSGTLEVGRDGLLSGDITLQRIWQRQADILPTNAVPGTTSFVVPSAGRRIQTSASGNLSYQHNRFFGVNGLRFLSQIRLNHDAVSEANPLTPVQDRASRYWINRLEYSIGRLQVGLVASFAQTDGKRNDLLMLRVTRDFGN